MIDRLLREKVLKAVEEAERLQSLVNEYVLSGALDKFVERRTRNKVDDVGSKIVRKALNRACDRYIVQNASDVLKTDAPSVGMERR